MESTDTTTIEEHGPDITWQGPGEGRLSEEAIALLASRPSAEVIHIDMIRWMYRERVRERGTQILPLSSWRKRDLFSATPTPTRGDKL